MLEGYSSLMGRDLSGLTRSLATVADDYPGDVVENACARLSRTLKYPPTPAELESACQTMNAALHPKVVELHSGIIDIDFGHGRIDMRGLTIKEQDEVMRNKGIIGGKNLALLSIDAKKELLSPQAVLDRTEAKLPATKIRRMGE